VGSEQGAGPRFLSQRTRSLAEAGGRSRPRPVESATAAVSCSSRLTPGAPTA